jgi:hypothetical protein
LDKLNKANNYEFTQNSFFSKYFFHKK